MPSNSGFLHEISPENSLICSSDYIARVAALLFKRKKENIEFKPIDSAFATKPKFISDNQKLFCKHLVEETNSTYIDTHSHKIQFFAKKRNRVFSEYLFTVCIYITMHTNSFQKVASEHSTIHIAYPMRTADYNFLYVNHYFPKL